MLCYIISSFLLHVYMFLALPASPVPGLDHYGDDDLPTIPEEIVPDELPSEVHTCTFIHTCGSPKYCRAGSFCQEKFCQLHHPLSLHDKTFCPQVFSPALMIT